MKIDDDLKHVLIFIFMFFVLFFIGFLSGCTEGKRQAKKQIVIQKIEGSYFLIGFSDEPKVYRFEGFELNGKFELVNGELK